MTFKGGLTIEGRRESLLGKLTQMPKKSIPGKTHHDVPRREEICRKKGEMGACLVGMNFGRRKNGGRYIPTPSEQLGKSLERGEGRSATVEGVPGHYEEGAGGLR